MVTFDVCPLFTSIQLEETINIICEQSELLLLMCLLNSEWMKLASATEFDPFTHCF